LIGKIVVHGGAGAWPRRKIPVGLAGVGAAAAIGVSVLRRGGSALDAVEAAVVEMENNPVFNAGKGSSLTVDGTIEMDAGIMDGRDLSAGAVALVRRVKNPVRLARIVMEETDHVLLAGREADKLAKAFSLPEANPMTPYRRKLLMSIRKKALDKRVAWFRKNAQLLRSHPEMFSHDTVGAIAVDMQGNFAASSSTGGTMMKLQGRIGDTPQIGSGLYADNRAGAATVTGIGEVLIKLTMSKAVCSMMERGATARLASIATVKSASIRLRGGAGVIAIDKSGRIASVHNTPAMLWAVADTRTCKPNARARGLFVASIRKVA